MSLEDLAMNFIQRGRILDYQIQQKKEQLAKLDQERIRLGKEVEIYQKVCSVIQKLNEILTEQHIESVSELVTYALRTIFYDRDYTFKIEVSDRGNRKKAEMFLLENTKDGLIQTLIPSGNGGGVQTVIGFVLQVYYIEYFSARKIILMDEALSQISIQYLDHFMLFLRTLIEEKGFSFLLITHDERLIPYADYVFSMQKGVLTYASEKS